MKGKAIVARADGLRMREYREKWRERRKGEKTEEGVTHSFTLQFLRVIERDLVHWLAESLRDEGGDRSLSGGNAVDFFIVVGAAFITILTTMNLKGRVLAIYTRTTIGICSGWTRPMREHRLPHLIRLLSRRCSVEVEPPSSQVLVVVRGIGIVECARDILGLSRGQSVPVLAAKVLGRRVGIVDGLKGTATTAGGTGRGRSRASGSSGGSGREYLVGFLLRVGADGGGGGVDVVGHDGMGCLGIGGRSVGIKDLVHAV